jgi:hypothetical protein
MAKSDDLLAVAFTDVNGNDKYNPHKDTLIAALVDTNHDGIVSAGDTIQFGSYPSVVGGTYTGDDYVITGTDTITVTDSSVRVDTGQQAVSWSANLDQEVFSTTVVGSTQFETFLRDGIDASVPDDEIQARSIPGGLAQPDTFVVELADRPGDQPFLDVLFFL